MQPKPKLELYRDFIHFIQKDTQRRRSAVNRRMFSVLLWCFILPVVISLTIMILIRVGVLPPRWRSLIEWLILLFPFSYALYFLGSEGWRDLRGIFRLGGTASALRKPLEDAEWRERTCEEMQKNVSASPEVWRWIGSNFQMDLAAMRYRNRYMTAFAAAIFFLILQGIDAFDPHPVIFEQGMTLLAQALDGIGQIFGLTLFLVLFYLSGSQVTHTLEGYANCVELISERS